MLTVILPSKNEKNAPRLVSQLEEMFGTNTDLQIIVCNDREGRGKGYAVRQAFTMATGDLVCFLDADGDIEPRMIKRLLPFLDDYDIVCGVKQISGLWSRRIITFLSRLYMAVMFDLKIDTQTGIKLFRKNAIHNWYSNGWMFDVEILSLAKHDGCWKMCEVPIEANVIKGVKVSSLWKTLKESITLWLELHGKHTESQE